MKLFKKSTKQGRKPNTSDLGRPNPAFSYYASEKPKITEDSVRSRLAVDKKELIARRLRLVPTIVACIVIVLSVIYSTTLSTKPVVVFVGEDSPYKNKQDYGSGIEKILGESIFNNSKLTINAKKTQSIIMDAYPELDAVSLELPVIGRRPIVNISISKPIIILTTDTKALIINKQGKVVSQASQLISSLREKLITVQDSSGLELNVGDQALTSESMKFIIDFKLQLDSKNLTISSATLPSVPNELDITIKNLSYYVKVDTTGDARIQAGELISIIEGNIKPKEYVDLRVEEKVFYK